MGDADLGQGLNVVAGDEEIDIEDRLNDLQEAFDEELDIVHEMFQMLEERTESLPMFIKLHRFLLEAFFSLNLFVVPLVMVILFAYFTSDLKLTEGYMALRQIIMATLILSSSIGFPLYLNSVWKMSSAERVSKVQQTPPRLFYMLMEEDEGIEGDVDSDLPLSEDSEADSQQDLQEVNPLNGEPSAPPLNNPNPTARNQFSVPGEQRQGRNSPELLRRNHTVPVNDAQSTDDNAISA